MSIGQQFGRLTVIEEIPTPPKVRRPILWKCLCTCGNLKEISKYSILHGLTTSCGCLRKEFARRPKTHGYGGHITENKTYKAWTSMKARCQNPNNIGWKDYGGRGVKVAHELQEFESFLAILGECPDGMTLDRIDPFKGYTADNVRWLPRRLQSRNQRRTKRYIFNGQTKTLPDWADEIGISVRTLQARLQLGYSIEKTLGTPLMPPFGKHQIKRPTG